MTGQRLMLATLAIVGLTTSASAFAVLPEPGKMGFFLSGNRYLQATPAGRSAYLEGNLDALKAGWFLDRNTRRADALDACTDDMPANQITAIVDKYLSANPSIWDLPMPYLAYNALLGSCRSRGISIE